MHPLGGVVAGDAAGNVPGGRHRLQHLFAFAHLDPGKIEAGVRAVEVAPPGDRFLHVVPGKGVEQAEAVVHLLAVVDHRPLHRQHLLRPGEPHRALVLPHQVRCDDQVDVVDPLQRLQAARFDALQADEVVRGGIEPALRLDVEHIGGLAAVVEEAPDGAGHEALRLAEDPGVLLEGADPGGLVVRTLDGDAEEGGHAGLHRLERDVAIARGLDVDAG